MTSPVQQSAPTASPAAQGHTAAASAPAATLDGAAQTHSTEAANLGSPHGANDSNGSNGSNGGHGGNGESGTQLAAQVIHVDSFLRPLPMGSRRLSAQIHPGWPAAPAVTLSFGLLTERTAANPGTNPAQPLVQGGMAARSHVAVSAEPQRHLALHDAMADVALEDWHDLLSAVMERLRLTVAKSMSTLPLPYAQVIHGAARLQSTVLECVLALDQLQNTLANEFNRRDGRERDIQAAHAALLHARNEQAHAVGEQRRLHDQAPRDGLATLPDRAVFSRHLERALACAAPQARTTTLLYIDLDGFKAINTAHGRSVGDELLGVVGARLARAVRADDMVSRIGSDEFACLISGPANPAQIRQLASKLFDVVAMPCVLGPLHLNVQPSIGIACCPADGDTAAALLDCADAAMLRAKRQQSGYAFFNQADAD